MVIEVKNDYQSIIDSVEVEYNFNQRSYVMDSIDNFEEFNLKECNLVVELKVKNCFS